MPVPRRPRAANGATSVGAVWASVCASPALNGSGRSAGASAAGSVGSAGLWVAGLWVAGGGAGEGAGSEVETQRVQTACVTCLAESAGSGVDGLPPADERYRRAEQGHRGLSVVAGVELDAAPGGSGGGPQGGALGIQGEGGAADRLFDASG